jgi:cysteine desulfurase
MRPMVSSEGAYFDNNASTPPLPEVVEAVCVAMGDGYGNPSSIHHRGLHAQRRLAFARGEVAATLGARTDQIRFTSGGTEGNNIVLKSGRFRRIITTAIEHPSVLRPAERAAAQGVELVVLPVDADGLVDLDSLHRAIRERPEDLASIQWANSETGVLQPIADVATLCREHGVAVHVDAAQAVGRVPVGLGELPIDFLTFSGHKLHGPPGTGVLFVREAGLPPLLDGGGQEAGLRSGTENVPGIVGLAAALERRAAGLDRAIAHMRHLRDRFEALMLEAVPGVAINGATAPRVVNTSNLRFSGIDGQALVARLDQSGVLCSQTSACSSHRPEPSHVLTAMGLSEQEAFASVRFSFSVLNVEPEVEQAVSSIREVVGRLRAFMLV